MHGCSAITRRNYIDLNETKKESVNSSDILVYGDSDFEVKVYNRNSNLTYLIIGPLIPFIPFSLFDLNIVPNDRFKIELVLSSKIGKDTDAALDFSAMTIEEPLTKYRTVCWQYTASQIVQHKDFDLNFLKTDQLFASGKKLYQINCKLAANSIPASDGVFLKILGIKAVDQKTKKSYHLPSLVFNYRNNYQYEFFSPQ